MNCAEKGSENVCRKVKPSSSQGTENIYSIIILILPFSSHLCGTVIIHQVFFSSSSVRFLPLFCAREASPSHDQPYLRLHCQTQAAYNKYHLSACIPLTAVLCCYLCCVNIAQGNFVSLSFSSCSNTYEERSHNVKPESPEALTSHCIMQSSRFYPPLIQICIVSKQQAIEP